MKKPNAAVFAYVVIGVVFVLVFWMMNAAGHNIHRMKQRLTKLENSKTEKEIKLERELTKYKQLKFKDYKQIIGFMTSAYRDLDERMNTFVRVKDYPKLPNHLIRLQYLTDDLHVLKYQISMLAQFVHQLHACEHNRFGLCKTVDGSQMWRWEDYITLGQAQNGMEAKIASEARDEANEECDREKKDLRVANKKLLEDVREMEKSMVRE